MNATSTQANFTISAQGAPGMTISAMFSSFIDDEEQAEAEGERAGSLFSAWLRGYGQAIGGEQS